MLFYYDENDLIRLRPARQYLETLLPQLVPPILDVGVKKYTRHYRNLVRSPYLTVDKAQRRQPDIVADILAPEFTQFGPFNSILFNGMIGFGIDEEPELRTALRHFHAILEDHGTLLVGWNEDFIARDDLAHLLTEAKFVEERPFFEPAENPERHCFWWWRKDI